MLKVFTAFSGYDSQCLALDRLKRDFPDFDYELVGWSEIDKYAIKAHDALYPQWADRNYGDISAIDWSSVPDFDLFTYSSPCQDFSNAGLQAGGEEGSGTRSSLLWECRKAIVAKRPKYLLFENVKAVVGKKFLPLFARWTQCLEDYGYYNTWKVLNAKDYGVPQNRERVFLVSIRRDLLDPTPVYHFPKPFPLERRLKDVLEDKVEDKYYLSDTILAGFAKHNENHEAKGTGFKFKPKSIEDTASCIRANAATCPTDNYIKEEDGRIRKLTPTECFRLMGVEDDRISVLLGAGISNTQLYKLAGNSIVEDVLYHLFRKMFTEVDVEDADARLF